MAQWQASHQYPAPSAAEMDYPASMAPSAERRPTPSQSRIVEIASATGDQSAGGLLQFNISAPQHMSKSGSCYLRGNLRATTAAAGGWSFLGGEKATPIGSAASILNKFTLTMGGQVVEQIDQVGHLHNLLLTHTNAAYCANDSQVKELRSAVALVSATDYTFTIPIFSGVLNSGKHIPAFLVPQVNVSYDLQPVLQCLRASVDGQDNPTAYTVSNAFFVYEAIEPDIAYMAAVRAKLSEPADKMGNLKQYAINFLTYSHMSQSGSTGDITALQGLSSSSLRAVLYTSLLNAAGANATADDGSFTDTITNYASADTDLYIDGRQINQVRYNSVPVVYSELERALGRLGDPSLNSELVGNTPALKRGSYENYRYLAGVNCSRVDDADLAFTGTPVNQLMLRVGGRAVVANTTFHMWSCLDRVIMIDRNGMCRIVN